VHLLAVFENCIRDGEQVRKKLVISEKWSVIHKVQAHLNVFALKLQISLDFLHLHYGILFFFFHIFPVPGFFFSVLLYFLLRFVQFLRGLIKKY
jgi:hypothetical protein